jgi:hypothetical protein
MPDINCRVARIEQQQENQSQDIGDIKQLLEEVRDTQKGQQGFVRGMAFTITAIVSVAGFFINHLYSGK